MSKTAPETDPKDPQSTTKVPILVIGEDGRPEKNPDPAPEVEAPDLGDTQRVPTHEIQAAIDAAMEADENPNSFRLSLPHLNHAEIFHKLGLPSAPRVETESKCSATYFILDAATINNPSNQKFLKEEISVITHSHDFIITQDNEGNLIIFSLTERGGVEKLFDIESSIRNKIPSANILIGDCNLYNDQNELTLSDSNLDEATANILTAKSSGITYVSNRLAGKIANPNLRTGSSIKLRTIIHPDPKLTVLIEAISRVSEELGGPDKMIGYESELSTLLEFAGDDESHILSLEAEAGMGKSRLRTELLSKLPNSILCSVNPSDKNVQGSSLATIAQQLEEIAKSEMPSSTEEQITYQELVDITNAGEFIYADRTITLHEFNQLSHAQRIEFTAINPDIIKDLCLMAMQKLKLAKNPKTLFVLEDLHHADRISEPRLIELIQEFSRIGTEIPGKALVTTRPKEMYQSQAFIKLKNDHKKGLQTVTLNGLPMLTENHLAKAFAFHSLPLEIRRNEKGENLEITDWYKTLAVKANGSPWIMKNFMDQICQYGSASEPYPNLEITSTHIKVKDEVLKRITEINSESDLTKFYQERLAVLDKTSKSFLQYIALMGEKLGAMDGYMILHNIMGLDNDAYRRLTEILQNRGYIKHDSKRAEYCNLQHETTRDIVLDSIPPAEKAVMAKNLYELFKDNEGVDQQIKYNLATIIAQSIPANFRPDEETEIFWSEYNNLSKSLLQQADARHDIESIQKIAETGLALPNIQDCLKSLKSESCPYDSDIIEMTVNYLFKKAENSMLAGKFDSTEKDLQEIKKIHSHNPSRINVLRMHRITFDRACMQYNIPQMKAAHEAIVQCGTSIPPTEKAILDILLAHFEERYDDVDKIYQKNKVQIESEANAYAKNHRHPSPQQLELRRICEARNPYEKLRLGTKIEGQFFDDDVIMQPNSLTGEDLATMQKIEQILNTIERTRRAHPLGFDSNSEVKIVEQQAGVKAFLGQHEEAVKLFAEAWRINDQLGLNDSAARSAKLKGDTQIIQALSLSEDASEAKLTLLREAISTYSNEGMSKSLSQKDMESNQYQYILRMQRIRAIGILALELHSQKDPVHKDELAQLVATSMEDFNYMNTAQKGLAGAWEGMIHYYFMGYIGHILNIANLNDLEVDSQIYDNEKKPYMQLPAIEKAIQYAEGYTDLGFGEVQRKINGLHILAKVLRRKQNHTLNGKRRVRDEKLATDITMPTAPNTARYKRPIGLGDSKEVTIVERPEPSTELVAKVQTLQSLYLELSQQIEPQAKIDAAIQTFIEMNKKYPEFANDPQTVYQTSGFMGHIIHFALENNLQVDETIFDGTKCPYTSTTALKAAYDFAQTTYDFGEKFEGQEIGIAETKSEGLFTLLSIIQEKDHLKKSAKSREKDKTNLLKRKAA